MKKLYLDLDGVMADFDAHFPSKFGLDHKGMADDAMWEIINSHPSYFLDMPMCDGAADFYQDVKHLNPIILTACPKTNYKNAATQKRQWVRNHLGDHLTVLPVIGGHNKPLFMHSDGDVLIDDYKKNCKAWEAHGGLPILHTDFENTRMALSSVFLV